MTRRVVLATANPDKAKEMTDILRAALGPDVQVVPRPGGVPDVIEDGETLEANARLKAAVIASVADDPAVADDTGLEVDALGGAPGVRSARFAGDDATYRDNVIKLLDALAERPEPAERTARFRTVAVALLPGGDEIVAEGIVDGTIARVPRGDGGFGYDSVFVPSEGDGRTFAEMTPAEKHAVSHRARALTGLAVALALRTRSSGRE
ncbi:MAG: RdgB/HAM1 family non-canonical purine NTP pyrophosphatase [Acidimicrobiales bacterium]